MNIEAYMLIFGVLIVVVLCASILVLLEYRSCGSAGEIAGTCSSCGYDVSTLPSGTRCPECGMANSGYRARTRRERIVHWNRLPASMFMVLVFCVPYIWPPLYWSLRHKLADPRLRFGVFVLRQGETLDELVVKCSSLALLAMLVYANAVAEGRVKSLYRGALAVSAISMVLDTVWLEWWWRAGVASYLNAEPTCMGFGLLGVMCLVCTGRYLMEVSIEPGAR